ncbi:protein disulfide-isomerase A6-like [Chiloscyllium punctatum]|uniref:protein disulfide-isomerase A6-like n=1 Tax=Chiloscyllium punctatum TaxID=137246 RepID=UPI003B6353D3
MATNDLLDMDTGGMVGEDKGNSCCGKEERGYYSLHMLFECKCILLIKCEHCEQFVSEWNNVANALKLWCTSDSYIIEDCLLTKLEDVLKELQLVTDKTNASLCDYCLEPEWANAIIELTRRTKGKVHLAAVDTSVNGILASRYRQMLSEEVLKTTCNHQLLCIIAVLPHISDTGSNGRADYLTLLMKIADKYRKKKWGWLWTESGDQTRLENALGIGGLMYPTIIAIDSRRKKKVLLKGSFSELGIVEFFRRLSIGNVSRTPISDVLPKSIRVKQWTAPKTEDLAKKDPIILTGPSFEELENDEL